MTHYVITVHVFYDEVTTPEDMAVQLEDNVTRCINNAELLNDSNLEAVVDDWHVAIERKSN